jgi:gliding motility-associated lipoprotein GldH
LIKTKVKTPQRQTILTMNKKLFTGIFLLLFVITSCGDNPYFQESVSFTNLTWSRKQKPTFVVDIKDANKTYEMILTFRTSTHYQYRNAWVYLNSVTPDKKRYREPFEIQISDDKGYWLGKKTGSIVENKLVFRNRKFPIAGKYTFVLEQGVIQKVLYGVYDIGLELKELK